MESLQLLSCSGNSHSQCNQNVNKILHIIKSQVSPVYNFTFTILHFVQSHLRPVYSFAHYTESVKSRKQLCTLYRASEGCFTILHIIQRQLRLVYNFTHCTALVMIYMIYLLTAIGLSPGGSSTVHIYTIHRTTQITTNVERVRAVPRLCEFYPGICLTTEEKAWKNLSQVKKNLRLRKTPVRLRETSVRVQYTYYQNTHTLQKPSHTHTHYKSHTHTHTYTLVKATLTLCAIYSASEVQFTILHITYSQSSSVHSLTHCKVMVKAVMNLRVAQNAGNFLTG